MPVAYLQEQASQGLRMSSGITQSCEDEGHVAIDPEGHTRRNQGPSCPAFGIDVGFPHRDRSQRRCPRD